MQKLKHLRWPLLLWSLPFAFLSFALPIYGNELGASALEIGGLFSTFTGTTLLIRPIAGWAIDNYGRRRFFIASLLLYAFSMVAFALASTLPGLYIARLLQGMGSAFFWVTLYTIVVDLSEEKARGQAFGWISQITSRGGIIGGFGGLSILIILSEDYSWQVIFISYTIFTLTSAFLTWRNLPETSPAQEHEHTPFHLSAMLVRLLVVAFATGVSQSAIAPIFIIYLQDTFTSDVTLLALAALPAGLVSAFFAARLGGLADRFGRPAMMAAGMMGSGLLAIALPHLPNLLWLAVFYTLQGITWAISEPAESALVAEIVGEARTGRGYGMYELAGQLGFAAGPLLGGLLYDRVSQATPFYINGLVLFLAAFWVIATLRRTGFPSPKVDD